MKNLIILAKDLNAISILDTYKSLLWVERYNKCGDFELYTPVVDGIFDVIKQDYYIQQRDHDSVMIIEKIQIESDAEDGAILTVTGSSLESILKRRIIWKETILSGNFQNGIKRILDENVISPSKESRKISNFVFKESTDPAITELTIEAQYTGDNVYDVISAACEEKGIGFRVWLTDDKKFEFELYAGKDRSYDQTKNPYVIFSPSYDNIVNSNYMESKSAWKNVTLVGGEGEGSARRYIAVGDVSGLDRRELFTDARDISSDISEDIVENFNFSAYPSQVFNYNTNTFVTDALFNSAMVDVSAYAGRVISISIPMYTNGSNAAPPYASVILNESKQLVSVLQKMEKDPYGSGSSSGVLGIYEIKLPTDAKYLYTSMFSQKAITDGIYYGKTTDFECSTIKLSDLEYNEQLRQRGLENLAENKEITSFEGEVETSIMFVYGVDFFMGDIVQIANEYGHEIPARILEIVMSDDEDGYSVYPTLSTIEEKGEITPYELV